MGVRSEPLHKNDDSIAWNKIAAIIAWLVSAFFTYAFLRQLMPSLFWVTALMMSLTGQFLLTLAERPIWHWAFRRGGKILLAGIIATAFDGALNAGGIYPFIPRLANTSLGAMFINAFEMSANVGSFVHLLIALILGTFSAGLAEYLWEVNEDE